MLGWSEGALWPSATKKGGKAQVGEYFFVRRWSRIRGKLRATS